MIDTENDLKKNKVNLFFLQKLLVSLFLKKEKEKKINHLKLKKSFNIFKLLEQNNI